MRHAKSRAIFVGLILLGLTGLGAALQQGFLAQGKWDFTEKTFSTILLAEPYPTLVADHEVYYLVLPNKQGVAVADAAPFNLHTVDILGSVIRDPDQPVAMIAVQGASAITSTGTSSTNPLQLTSTHTTATLRGEIVDSKCAFGAMNFGTLKCHRACAIACLSGDIPPVLVVRHDGGRTATHFLLLNASGKPMNQTALEFAALPIAITGRVTTIGSWNILRADPASIQTLP
ncbi:MAG: hypothetical protein J6386_15280 [Candidatus Synoicihabitans palmerolidicus]|nr:hypothetical protein [Candidatus Synoicihabitans palmerolidicus]